MINTQRCSSCDVVSWLRGDLGMSFDVLIEYWTLAEILEVLDRWEPYTQILDRLPSMN